MRTKPNSSTPKTTKMSQVVGSYAIFSVDHQLDILELQYQAVLNGTTLPTDSPIGRYVDRRRILDEPKKPSSELLPKPIDVVGDGEQQPEKKKKKKKTEKKKTWSREEILSTFLPPEKQTKKLKRGLGCTGNREEGEEALPCSCHEATYGNAFCSKR